MALFTFCLDTQSDLWIFLTRVFSVKEIFGDLVPMTKINVKKFYNNDDDDKDYKKVMIMLFQNSRISYGFL